MDAALTLELAKVSPATKPADQASEMEVINDPRIYLGLPAFGGKIDTDFANCLLRAHQELGQADGCLGIVEWLQGDSLVNRARNNLAFMFLKGSVRMHPDGKERLHKYEWMLFLDTDLIFSPQDIATIYMLGRERGPDVYCGAYPIKKLKPAIVFNQMAGHKPDKDGVVQVRESGTGFMLIHRKVFETMIDKLVLDPVLSKRFTLGEFESAGLNKLTASELARLNSLCEPHLDPGIRYENDAGDTHSPRTIKWDFFKVGVKRDSFFNIYRFLSEDWFFCQRWHDLGGKIFLHTRIQCGHIGKLVYPPDPREIIEVAEIYKNSIPKAQLDEMLGKPKPVPIFAPDATDHSAAAFAELTPAAKV